MWNGYRGSRPLALTLLSVEAMTKDCHLLICWDVLQAKVIQGQFSGLNRLFSNGVNDDDDHSSLSTRKSSSLSWCTSRLHGGALPVPAIDSIYRRLSVAVSVAGSLHQIYRYSPISTVKPITISIVTMSYIISFLHRHKRHNTLCDLGDIICNFL